MHLCLNVHIDTVNMHACDNCNKYILLLLHMFKEIDGLKKSTLGSGSNKRR